MIFFEKKISKVQKGLRFQKFYWGPQTSTSQVVILVLLKGTSNSIHSTKKYLKSGFRFHKTLNISKDSSNLNLTNLNLNDKYQFILDRDVERKSGFGMKIIRVWSEN